MLRRSQRLQTSAFSVAFRQGRVLRHPLLHLRVYKRQDGCITPRVAFVAAKKLGTAVRRNRLRRRIGETYRLQAARFAERLAGCDLIFLAMPAALTATTQELEAAILQLLNRIAGPGAQAGAAISCVNAAPMVTS